MESKDQPVIAGLRSIKIETEVGTYFWCSCGRSNNQPFCDGSHSTTHFKPMPVSIVKKQLIKWCSCKHTKTPPYCDHSHRVLPGYTSKES